MRLNVVNIKSSIFDVIRKCVFILLATISLTQQTGKDLLIESGYSITKSVDIECQYRVLFENTTHYNLKSALECIFNFCVRPNNQCLFLVYSKSNRTCFTLSITWISGEQNTGFSYHTDADVQVWKTDDFEERLTAAARNTLVDQDQFCVSKSDPCYGKYSYRGFMNRSINGFDCQVWSSQTPHEKDENLSVDNSNYCRNPSGESSGPWCFTALPSIEWETCEVPTCDVVHTDCYSSSDMGRRTHRGKVNRTRDGDVCQHWQDEIPHTKGLHFSQFNHNYCRNPSNNTGGTWCYTLNATVRWAYCDISPC